MQCGIERNENYARGKHSQGYRVILVTV